MTFTETQQDCARTSHGMTANEVAVMKAHQRITI